MEELQAQILKLFVDSSNRPKRTPRHESAIQIILENEYLSGRVKNELYKLTEKGELSVRKHKIKNVGEAKFYFSNKLEDNYIRNIIPKKVKKLANWIGKYSDIKVIRMLGEHLHYLVKNELRAQGFEIIEEKNVRKYEYKEWSRSKHSLDLVAKHNQKKLVVGVEIKNMLTLTPKSEIITKLEMCEHLGITPVFACRWMEQYRSEIMSENGYLWQFKKQLYPLGQEKFVNEIQKRFQLPIEVKAELPRDSIIQFREWLNSI